MSAMTHTNAHRYKAELLVRLPPIAVPFRVAINGGCDLTRKCAGAGDYIAEEIQMPLLNSGVVTASWTPHTRSDSSTFTATFAGYAEPNGDFIRFGNAHSRDILHTDINYRGQIHQHDKSMKLVPLQMINRRRIALLSLMQTLELNVDWRIPEWFYMPWSMWWAEYGDLPARLQSRRPSGALMFNICEAVMVYLSFNPGPSESFLSNTGITKQTMEAIDEAIDHVVYALGNTGTFEFRQIVFGRVTVIPFPMYAPPGSGLEGSSGVVEQLLGW